MEPPTARQFEESFLSNDHLAPLSHDNNMINNGRNATYTNITIDKSPPSIFKSIISSQDQIIAMISNYSTSYNVVSISILIPILSSSTLKYAQYLTPASGSLVASALIAGMIIGQLVGGFLGDLIGRKNAMMFVMTLQILGCLGSSIFISETPLLFIFDGWNIFEQLGLWRFIVGLGCGGVYPLAAAMSSESTTSNENDNNEHEANERDDHDAQTQMQVQKLKMLATTFSTQGVGFVSVPIVGLSALLILGENNMDIVWRLILFFGSIPGFILLVLRFRAMHPRNNVQESEVRPIPQDDSHGNAEGEPSNNDEESRIESHALEVEMANDSDSDDDEEENESIDEGESKQSLWSAIRNEENLLMKLIGTAGTWFLFDVVFYGNTLFQPVVIKTAFGYDDGDNANQDDEFSNIVDNIRDSMILSIIALPGYFVSIALIGRRIFFKFTATPRFIQIQGFAIMALLYLIIGISWEHLTEHHWLLVLLYGNTFFFSNYGPNTTTFMLPSITFSENCKSTLNGISAAAGKAGALTGSLLFEPIANKYGDGTVMMLCAFTSVIAGIITYFCTKPPKTRSIGVQL